MYSAASAVLIHGEEFESCRRSASAVASVSRSVLEL
jgi:hypothetical protein